MPFKTVAQLKDTISGLLTSFDLDQVSDLNGSLQRSARLVSQKVNIPESSGRQAYTIYSGVTDYLAPDIIFGSSLTDFRPIGVSRSVLDYVYKKPIELFDRTKCLLPNGYSLTFEYNKGIGIARIASPKPQQRIILDPVTVTTGWVVGGSASGLAVDSTVFYQSPASLRFNLAAAGSQGYLEKTISSQDLSSYQGVGVVFIAVEMPSVNITSIGVRIGSSSSKYYEVSNTAGFLGSFVAGTFLIIALDLSLATLVGGSVDMTKIVYTRIFFNYNGTALNNVRVGAFFISLPSQCEMIFKTAAIFLNPATGNLSNTINTDDDQIILNDSGYTLYELEAAAGVAFSAGGGASNPVISKINADLNGIRARNGAVVQLGLYDLYRAANPSQEVPTIGSYYD